MDRSVIRGHLDHCITETSLGGLGERYSGKVRDTYRTPDGDYVLIATDRISAFDHILPRPIPFKGQVLNGVSAHFFDATRDIVPNHVLSTPDPNVTVALHCLVVPIEFVVRGYLAGHAWRVYREGGRELCGQTLPEGLRQNSQLPTPILTPATKAVSGHDVDISQAEIIRRGILDRSTLDELEAVALRLFERGSEIAAAQGLILVDTKYEFGRDAHGTLRLVDEVHTPDSSRYFYADTYASLLAADEPQRQLSKEFVREWLMANGFQGRQGDRMPEMPDDFRCEISERYVELFQAVTGQPFVPDLSPTPVDRIAEALAHLIQKEVAEDD